MLQCNDVWGGRGLVVLSSRDDRCDVSDELTSETMSCHWPPLPLFCRAAISISNCSPFGCAIALRFRPDFTSTAVCVILYQISHLKKLSLSTTLTEIAKTSAVRSSLIFFFTHDHYVLHC